jgi:hypothetical protein
MNNERPTPETDAYLASLEGHAYCDLYGVHHLDAEFARKLERERNSLWELHNKNAARSAELLNLCNTLRKERDETLKLLASKKHSIYEWFSP